MSLPFRIADALAWTGGRLADEREGSGAPLQGVSTDTRRLVPGALFVAIRGPRHDAHDHLAAAIEGGAAALLVERSEAVPSGCSLPVVVVEDTTRALGALAAGHRRGFAGPVVAITGSNGKTTTKEMCAAILGVAGPCLKNRGNLNNEFGLPLTLLEREAEHTALVVELGMNHRGEIAPLAEIARPTVAVITNVGTAHIEHLGSQDEIALEKGDLIAALPADAVAVLNADDPRVMAQASRTRVRVVTFGRSEKADLRAEAVLPDGATGFRFDLVLGRERHEVSVAGLGEPTVINALAAAAAAWSTGAPLAQVVRGLAAYGGVPGRMARVELDRGCVLIDDTYNANPQSTDAALRSLVHWAGRGRSWAVLGSMGELGDTTQAAHQAMGRLAAELGVTGLLALGDHAPELASGARAAGMNDACITVARSQEELAQAVDALLEPGDWVLVKGSRSMAMERVVEALVRSAEARGKEA